MATSANTLPVRDFYDSLPAEDKKSFRENVRVASGLEYYQFTYRLRNNTWTPSNCAPSTSMSTSEATA